MGWGISVLFVTLATEGVNKVLWDPEEVGDTEITPEEAAGLEEGLAGKACCGGVVLVGKEP